MNPAGGKRTIGLDMHPDVFSAAALFEDNQRQAQVEWRHDRMETARLEEWARKYLRGGDTVVLEASGNSFEVVSRLHACGVRAVVLESTQAGQIRDNYCNDDIHSAVKLARVYNTGLAKIVWTPDEKSRERREVLFAYRNSVKDATRARNRIRSGLNEYCARLPQGTRLTEESGLKTALGLKEWSPLQKVLIEDNFKQLWQEEARRKKLEQIMIKELCANPEWSRLWRLMGVRHCVAFALMAIIGDIHRFPTAKKLVGYVGLAPRRDQSGNNAKGYDRGVGSHARNDLRALLLQSAQNALAQKGSPLHQWGWKLTLKKNRNKAAVAVARKLTVSIWHLLMGHFTPLTELPEQLRSKLLKLATALGIEQLKEMGYDDRDAFVQKQFTLIQLSA